MDDVIQKQTVERNAAKRMEQLEEMFSHRHVPCEVMCLYMMYCLIAARSVSQHLRSYPGQIINLGDAQDAKMDIFNETLTPFERDSIALLNEEIERRERNERPIELLPSPRSLQLNG